VAASRDFAAVRKAAPVAAFPVVSPACIPQGDSPAVERFRGRENLVGTSGQGTGFTNQQCKGE